MRAGKLKHIIDLVTERRTQSASGFVSVQKVVLMRCRAHIVKWLPSYDKDGISAREQFDGETITFQIRDCRAVQEATSIVYKEQSFHISLSQPAAGNTVLITCKKLNQ